MSRCVLLTPVSESLAFAVVGVIGIVLGAGAVLAFRVSERIQQQVPEQPEPAVPTSVSTVLSVLRSSAVVIDAEDHVLKATAPAHALGLVKGDRLALEEMLELVHKVRRDGQIRERDLVIGSGVTAAQGVSWCRSSGHWARGRTTRRRTGRGLGP